MKQFHARPVYLYGHRSLGYRLPGFLGGSSSSSCSSAWAIKRSNSSVSPVFLGGGGLAPPTVGRAPLGTAGLLGAADAAVLLGVAAGFAVATGFAATGAAEVGFIGDGCGAVAFGVAPGGKLPAGFAVATSFERGGSFFETYLHNYPADPVSGCSHA